MIPRSCFPVATNSPGSMLYLRCPEINLIDRLLPRTKSSVPTSWGILRDVFYFRRRNYTWLIKVFNMRASQPLTKCFPSVAVARRRAIIGHQKSQHGGAIMPFGGNDWQTGHPHMGLGMALGHPRRISGTRLPICDPHHHFWDYRTERVPNPPAWTITGICSTSWPMISTAATTCHWSIENNLHWTLDVTFREDLSRVRSTVFVEALNLLKKETTLKRGIQGKRLKSGWVYLLKVLLG